MLSEALSLELGSLSTLQRKLLLELLQRRYPQFWSSFANYKNSWQSRKESLEEFIQNHKAELVKEFVKACLGDNGWKTTRRCKALVQG